MRRAILLGSLALIAALAVVSYWSAHRSIVVGRAMLGGPPPQARQHETLTGRAAPSFSAVDQDGHATGTASLNGRVAVVDVWATWCKPCVMELPRVEREIWQKFRPDVAVIAVARGEDAARVRDFATRTNLTFALVADPRQEISRRFGGDDAIPRTYVIDRSGKVVYQTIGYDEKSFNDVVSSVEGAIARR